MQLLLLLQSRKQAVMEVQNNRVFKFDAFVCYNEHDSQWVLNEILPRLEGPENHLKLCLHKRDWLVGRDIVDNIVESMEDSRKTLLIVSNAFASSQWCHFELTMAQTRLFRDDINSLILVLLEEIDDVNMTPRLRLQMARQTYVEWTDNPVGQQLFWAKLTQALTSPLTSVRMDDSNLTALIQNDNIQ